MLVRKYSHIHINYDRFISEKNFYRLVQRALARETAIHSEEHQNRLQRLNSLSTEECESMLQALLKVRNTFSSFNHYL